MNKNINEILDAISAEIQEEKDKQVKYAQMMEQVKERLAQLSGM